MSTSTLTLTRFEVGTATSKTDRRSITVAAKDEASARAAAIAAHRAEANLPHTATVLAFAARPLPQATAPAPMTKAQVSTMVRNRRGRLTGGDDAA